MPGSDSFEGIGLFCGNKKMHDKLLLNLLEGVKRTKRNSYVARCPAHDDKSPSLSVAFTDEGRILVHCFAGCSAGDIMAAVGLSLGDLFPDGPIDHALKGATPWLRKERKQQEDKDEHNRLVIAAAESDRGKGRRLTKSQLKEEREAWLALRGSKK